MRARAATTAEGWEKWDDYYARHSRDIADWFCRATAIGPGSRVLDVACGSGQPALPIAARVAPGGRVVAVDVSSELLEVARRLARAKGLSNVEFAEMAAEKLDFPDASFDAVTCGFMLMFSSDPVRVVSEIRRVLVPGGRFAIAVWDEPSKSPFFRVMFQSLGEFAPLPAPDPNAPGMYRFGRPGELEQVLRAGGLSEFSIESRPFDYEFERPEHYFELFNDVAAPVRNAVDELSDADRERLYARVLGATEPYQDNGRLRLTASPLCASGKKTPS